MIADERSRWSDTKSLNLGIVTVTKTRLLAFAVGWLTLVLVPYIQFSYFYGYWTPGKLGVDKNSCSCSCWDTIFKGNYQGAGVGYKHVYFNITRNSFKIWAVTLLSVLMAYECIRYLIKVLLTSTIRWSMLILLVSVFYPHYYAWWSYFNYWNDEFYEQWYHQTFFTLTELVSTLAVVSLVDTAIATTPQKLLLIADIAVLHILAAGGDQFVRNIFFGEGRWHQKIRDVGFLVPDVLHLFIALLELYRYASNNGLPVHRCIRKEEVILSISGIIVFLLIIWSL